MRSGAIPRYVRAILVLAVVLAGLAGPTSVQPAQAAVIAVPAGDVPALIAAINTANANSEADRIELAGGTYTLTTPAMTDVVGTGGLPFITSEITIIGNGATITRSSAEETPAFRILAVIQGGDLTLDSVTISNGRADIGAGIFLGGGVLRLTNSTVTNNHAADGGGINVNVSSTAFVTNSTITGNTASGGGGGIANSTQLHVINSTITDNSSGVYGGGGLYVDGVFGTSITNTIIAGNTSPGPSVDIYGSVTGTNNLIGDGTNSTGLMNGVDGNQVGTAATPIDPLLGDLASSGGLTQTIALQPGSPAIDAGTTTDETPTTDQRGTTRPQGTANDIGAYELVDGTAPSSITPTISGTLGSNGWYTSDVNLSWSITEPESRVVSSTGCDATTMTTDTVSQTVTCQATSVGGTASESVIFKRDATAPTVTYTGNLGTYGLSDTIAITCTATDTTSGVASDDCTDITGNAAALGLGSHTFSALATDNAGNVGSGSTSFVVGVTTYAELCTMTQQSVRHPILARTACAVLKVAQRADQTNNLKVERMVLNMYRLQIRVAMVLRAISVMDGQQLLDWSYAFD